MKKGTKCQRDRGRPGIVGGKGVKEDIILKAQNNDDNNSKTKEPK